MKQLLASLKAKTKTILFSRHQLKQVDALVSEGMPSQLRPALEFLITGKADDATQRVVEQVERIRSNIAKQGDKRVQIFYSPKPGSAGDDPSKDVRPEAGEVKNFTMEQIARTGKKGQWATALHLIAKGFQTEVVFELGSCAGISAAYLASAPTVRTLVTVEGSKELAQIASNSLEGFKSATVVNSLFEEAIDDVLPLPDGPIDLAYIDGHHEKIATIHYFNRLHEHMNAGGVVLFDDISWSQDMRDGWTELSQRTEFEHAIDLGVIGVCVLKSDAADKTSRPKLWDLQTVFGKRPIGNPHGWTE